MINQFIRWFETKTEVYLYPRFVILFGFLFTALILFIIVFFMAWSYSESVKTIGPVGPEVRAEYDARMRSRPAPPLKP